MASLVIRAPSSLAHFMNGRTCGLEILEISGDFRKLEEAE
jgi:hypothetical protein